VRSTRRAFLAGSAGAGLGAALGAVGDGAAQAAARTASRTNDTVPFYGRHQAGIATPTQDHLQFASFDMASNSVNDLRKLLEAWSAAAALIAAGRPVGALQTGSHPPVDTGEAMGLSAARATVTFGIGPGVFGTSSHDRFGLAGKRPAPLVDLPRFKRDALEPTLSGGDLAVQVCADDFQVAFHAIHDLIRIAHPAARPRWLLAGSGRTGNTAGEPTPRNLMGFKDGTANPVSQDNKALDKFVWASGPDSPPWMRGGSYMVVRRIMIMLGGWDATSLDHQEAAVGRYKASGAPLGEKHEHDSINLAAQRGGSLVIPYNAHIRLASPGYNHGQRILRRGYSFMDGLTRPGGPPAVGQLFICFQRDPRAQFIPIQHRLAYDAMSKHTRHVGSAVFACPPGAAAGGFVGQGLFS
jgi:deferrochelatase/peroxidase EfeB